MHGRRSYLCSFVLRQAVCDFVIIAFIRNEDVHFDRRPCRAIKCPHRYADPITVHGIPE